MFDSPYSYVRKGSDLCVDPASADGNLPGWCVSRRDEDHYHLDSKRPRLGDRIVSWRACDWLCLSTPAQCLRWDHGLEASHVLGVWLGSAGRFDLIFIYSRGTL